MHDADVVIDTVGGDTFDRSWGVLKPGGILVTTVADVQEGATDARGVRAKHIVSQADGNELAQIAKIIDGKLIEPIVTTVLPSQRSPKSAGVERKPSYSGKDRLECGRRAKEMRRMRRREAKVIMGVGGRK